MHVVEADVPSNDRVGVLLGGLDSALVASGLKRLGKKVETFSFGFENSMFNQAHTDRSRIFSCDKAYMGVDHARSHSKV